MSVTVPKEDKVYTTTYDRFRGVDFTNDASNAWKHRSPSGLNMLPEMDGHPYKRTGWDIAVTAQEFRDAAGVDSSVEVIPDRVHYFELGGYDFLMIFNNLGVFSYRTNPVSQSSGSFEHILVHLDTYIDLNDAQQDFPPAINGQNVPIDSGRAFFFEGGGTAGFYLFVGLKLFRYDGTYFREVDPYTPIVLISCDATGAGTALEQINMLTSKRIVQYACDGTTKSFTVPGGFYGSPKVETRNANNGNWETASGYSASAGKIDFSTAPKVVVDGEDNLRVTYTPDGSGSNVVEESVTRGEKTFWVKRIRKQRQQKINGHTGDWETYDTKYEVGGASFDTSNIKINNQTKTKEITYQCRNSNNTNWTTMSTSYFSPSWGAYNNTVTMKAKQALYSSNIPISKTTTTTSKPSGWKVTSKPTKNKSTWTYTHYRTVTDFKYYRVRIVYTSYKYNKGATAENKSVTAFTQCSRALVFGSGIINQVFMSSTPKPDYNTRIWYSKATDPSYFPDTNYIEVGSTDTPIMGMMKVGEYLGVVKRGVSFDTSIYLAYPTSFETDTTYAVKQNVNGIGAISAGAFNTLNEEPLFLSEQGIMGIEVSEEDVDRQLRNRSYYVNKKLCSEDNLQQAISFVHDGMYYLAVNNRCYVLDGSQKNSWENTKTNLQYECYYLENIPAQCFARFEDRLWFTDFRGNLCRFKTDRDNYPYRDAYTVGEPDATASSAPSEGTFQKTDLSDEVTEGSIVRYGLKDYTVTSVGDTTVTVTSGVPIKCVWSTIADDDGAVHFFKNLQKKGCVVSLLPSSDSGVRVYLKADEHDPVLVGETDAKDYSLPFDFYVKKKVKKYKRLQIIVENDDIDDAFGVDQIVKSYTIGNYSKNKG